MPIRVLDAATVGRISAGEVVERPSSVVKELVENSLDAGATSITVEIRNGGIDYLRVTDNGCGIEPNQVRIAFENHATSKLQNAEQLDDIRTMGFRGEALPSIAAVSKVEMTTRTKSNETGVKFTSDGGRDMRVSEIGCPVGTTIVMRDLFFNVPVRRTFLKRPSYEGGLVSDTVSRMLLGNPGVSVRYISGGNTIYHSRGDGKLRNAVFAVYGKETAAKMTEVDAYEGGTRIYGLIGTGELGKQTRGQQMFFINGRSVRCAMLTKALESVCRSRVTIGMYPMCVLNLVVPPTSVDVNVHPNKLEVRFRDEEGMRDTIERLLNKAYEGERVLDIDRLRAQPQTTDTQVKVVRTEIKPTANERTGAEKPFAEPMRGAEAKPFAEPIRSAGEKPKMPPIPGLDMPIKRSEPTADLPKILPAANGSGISERFGAAEARLSDRSNVLREDAHEGERQIRTVALPGGQRSVNNVKTPDAATEKPIQMTMDTFAPMKEREETQLYRVIGVVFKTYILVESGDMLLLIDQHAAHERIRYEQLVKRLEEGTASQQLLDPIVFSVTPRELSVVSDNLEVLEEAGYSVETFGERDLRVTAVPFVLGKAEVRPLFLEMLGSLSRLKNATNDIRRGEIMQLACKSAVKGGDPLSQSEIDALIREMRETGAPSTCPHGRPVVKVMTKRDLEKMFKRIQ